MQVPILNGIYTDGDADFRSSYPRNMVPVPKQQGISSGYLRPSEGLVQIGEGPGVDRGGINWNGACYRVMGSSLVRVDGSGSVSVLGDVGSGGQVTLDYSFDRLAIASGGRLYYWNGATLNQVTDPDLGVALDVQWVDGYFMTTDGEFLVVTELNDPFQVNPLKYGSSEADPDPVKGILKLRNEIYALNRHTIEVFDNVGGDGFPFARIEGAQVQKGAIGTQACSLFGGTIAFLGSGRNETPGVYLVNAGNATPISTREIDTILQGYRESDLANVVLETRVHKKHEQLYMHLPDQCWVYDLNASQVLGEPAWAKLTTSIVGDAIYRARNFVWCYDRWIFGDPTSNLIGTVSDEVSTHFEETIGWDFNTMVLYSEGNDAIVHELELVALPGRVAFGLDPTIWTSYSLDGETWSQERPIRAGKTGERNKRLAWRTQGKIENWRIQRFRGTSDAHVSVARLEAQIEPLFTRPRNG